MDLSLIQTHIENFADTWQGWGKIIEGISNFGDNNGFLGLSSTLLDGFKTADDATLDVFNGLSTNLSDAFPANK